MQRFNADQPSAWVNLGDVYGARGEAQRAEDSYRTALEMDPAWIPAYVNYADWLRGTNRDADGEKILRAGLTHRPKDAALHHSLGLLLVRRKDMSAALAELGRAAELAPDNPRFSYVYAVALQSTGKHAEALAVTESALRQAPGDRELDALRRELAAPSGGRLKAGKISGMTSPRRAIAGLLAFLVAGALLVYARPGLRPVSRLAPATAGAAMQKRWLFVWRDMSDPKEVDRMIARFPRAQADGYNGVAFAANIPSAKAAELRQAAKKHGLDLVAIVMGGSRDRNYRRGRALRRTRCSSHTAGRPPFSPTTRLAC